MRLHKLAGALCKSTHLMQVFFLVDDGLERCVVQQVMDAWYPTVECRLVSTNKSGVAIIPDEFGELSADIEVCIGSTMFAARTRGYRTD